MAIHTSSNSLVETIDHYDSRLSEILSRFERTGSAIRIDRSDDPKLRQYLQEIVDLLNDSLGSNAYSRRIAAEANEGISNFLGTPSYKSVESVIGILRAARTSLVRRANSAESMEPPNHSTQTDIWMLMHQRVVEIARPRFAAGHFADSVEAAFKELNSAVKALHMSAANRELDGVPLMRQALAPGKPTIILGDLAIETGFNIQQGYMELFAGSMSGIRNPKAHDNLIITAERALHHLMLASLLFHKLDERVDQSSNLGAD